MRCTHAASLVEDLNGVRFCRECRRRDRAEIERQVATGKREADRASLLMTAMAIGKLQGELGAESR